MTRAAARAPASVGGTDPGRPRLRRVQGSWASGYTTLSGPTDQSASAATRYSGFVNVTSAVQEAGPGIYSVANVQAGKGGDRYAGWTLVVAYRDPSQPPRNLTVDDGFVTINSSAPPTTIPITGFRTPPSGAVNTTLGFVAYEGDGGLTGDSAALNGVKLTRRRQPAEQLLQRRHLEPRRQRHDPQSRTTWITGPTTRS